MNKNSKLMRTIRAFISKHKIPCVKGYYANYDHKYTGYFVITLFGFITFKF